MESLVQKNELDANFVILEFFNVMHVIISCLFNNSYAFYSVSTVIVYEN